MRDMFMWGALVLAAIFVSTIVAYCLAIPEANTFNKFTKGPKATPWDAMFIELRVQTQ